MLYPPFYDPLKSYEENYATGPFNGFADGVVLPEEEPFYNFLGVKISSPFGIPAGPLLNSAFVKAAFDKRFDVSVYKTVRTQEFPCHPFPNVLSVKVEDNLTIDKAQRPLVADVVYAEPLSITNSFGVPSRTPSVWQADVRQALQSARNGQVMVMSFMGSAREHQTPDEFVSDFVAAAHLSLETGAKIYEANLSCPNIGNEGLVCYNFEMTERIAAELSTTLGGKPLILKVGYYESTDDVRSLAAIVKKYAQGVSSINTISALVINKEGKQALPGGPTRSRSGVCGSSIRWAGLEMVRRLTEARAECGADFAIVGCGGVMKAEDFHRYRDVGADVVMSATGAMWNPYLARDVIESLHT